MADSVVAEGAGVVVLVVEGAVVVEEEIVAVVVLVVEGAVAEEEMVVPSLRSGGRGRDGCGRGFRLSFTT